MAIEAGRSDGWYKYVNHDALIIGIDRFGASRAVRAHRGAPRIHAGEGGGAGAGVGETMKLAEMLREQLEREIGSTRKMLERVPEGKQEWKPHPKSMPLGYLAALNAGMFGWIAKMIDHDHLDLAGGAGPQPGTADERLAAFDKAVETRSRAVEHHRRASAETVAAAHGRQGARRKAALHHDRRHDLSPGASPRALSVYLRLNDRPVPSMYGPTADEGWQKSE